MIGHYPVYVEEVAAKLRGGSVMSLREELNSLRLKGESRRSPEVVAQMHRAVDELRRSGAAERVLKIGDKMPEFALPNANEQIVDSKALLSKGPLILQFYRGRW